MGDLICYTKVTTIFELLTLSFFMYMTEVINGPDKNTK